VNARSEIERWLDAAVVSGDVRRTEAALLELVRWLGDDEDASWHAWVMAERWRQMVELSLHASSGAVRAAAADALGALATESAETAVTDGLGHTSMEVRVAAAEALVRMKAESYYARVAGVMREIVDSSSATDLRRRAGAVLAGIAGATDPFHQPIQAALLEGDYDKALRLVDAALDIFPVDVDLFWWRGHALRGRGALADAAQSFAHAAELMQSAAVIWQALADVLLELREDARAVESARRSVGIAPYDADAQAILALCCYRTGAYAEAGQAAAQAIDLNPVHPKAIWIAVLAALRQGDLESARTSFRHARTVWQTLSPGFDVSYRSEVLNELSAIVRGDDEVAVLIADIRQSVGTGAGAAG
jgi:tetratricopeptide (TPR) repeat protein